VKPSGTHSEAAQTIDALPRQDALDAMLVSHVAALVSLKKALPQIDAAAEIIASALSDGSTLFYAAAGSSGLMALADASELPGTFGVRQEQIRICMAGGVPVDGCMPGETEDATDDAAEAANGMADGDVAIVVSASGTTLFALAFAEAARERGSKVIAVANAPGSRLLALGDVAVALPTAPEVVSGSTRLGAGTAQKVALNMISTQAGILLGHVHDGMMVNLNPDNIKLRKRAVNIVMEIANVPEHDARDALSGAGYDTKIAALTASGVEVRSARGLLEKAKGRLRDCLPHKN